MSRDQTCSTSRLPCWDVSRKIRTAAGTGPGRSFLPPASTACSGLEHQEHRQHPREHRIEAVQHGAQDNAAGVAAAPSRFMTLVTEAKMIKQVQFQLLCDYLDINPPQERRAGDEQTHPLPRHLLA